MYSILPSTSYCCHVLISHLVPHSPPHIHHLGKKQGKLIVSSLHLILSILLIRKYLVLESVLFPAVLLDLGVDVLHQAVPLHQHVSEGGAREDSHNLGSLLKLFFVQEFFLF